MQSLWRSACLRAVLHECSNAASATRRTRARSVRAMSLAMHAATCAWKRYGFHGEIQISISVVRLAPNDPQPAMEVQQHRTGLIAPRTAAGHRAYILSTSQTGGQDRAIATARTACNLTAVHGRGLALFRNCKLFVWFIEGSLSSMEEDSLQCMHGRAIVYRRNHGGRRHLGGI